MVKLLWEERTGEITEGKALGSSPYAHGKRSISRSFLLYF
ncbi:hypothetical protein J2Z58_001846 [Halobacillus andaensis]|nr:hypothetical protein [Halobacillus andaensis]